ncbi:hypothetical protein KSS87_006336 [Heliosperma pusillum]|nr:hypothetical protein KSS87_006336 [Heliosperma pusillum]
MTVFVAQRYNRGGRVVGVALLWARVAGVGLLCGLGWSRETDMDCKTALNLAKSRIKLMKNKKDAQVRQLKREIAQLLQNKQDQTARIRVEHVVREEKMLTAYEMIEIYCELIVARLPIIESQKNCPLDLKEAIASLIFAAPRCGDIPELQDVRKHFTAKYGKDFATAATELRPASGVSRTVVEKLSVQAPDGPTKVKILKGIAAEHNIQWEPNWFKDEDLVPSGDTPKKLHADNNNKIQMEPLNIQIADGFEEKHADTFSKYSENSSQSQARPNKGEVPSSPTSRPVIRPSENVSGTMLFSQSSMTSENASGRQQWNMEFKDAAAAAQAAAESAERASMAARAAAELSIRDSYRHGPSSVRGVNEGDVNYAGSVLQHKHEQANSINSSFNQRKVSMERNQGPKIQQNVINEGVDVRSSDDENSQFGLQYDARQQELQESKSTSSRVNAADNVRQSRDHVSNPNTSKGDYNWSNSANIHEYDTEPDDNPFHEEAVELHNQPIKFDSESSGFGDDYDSFSNSKYQSVEIGSGSSFGAFGQGISDEESWHAKTIYVSKSNSFVDETISRNYGERDVFKESDEKNDEFDSRAGVVAGLVQKPNGLDINEKVGRNVVNAVFDESDSDDDDDERILDATDKYDSPSGKLSPRHALLHKDGEPDLSESFRNSPIYSKLFEPLPVTFDDYDTPSPKSEKLWQKENTEPEIGNYNDRKPDCDSHMNIDDSFVSNKQTEEKQNLNVGSLEGKGSESPRSFNLTLESKDRLEFDDETYSNSEGGMELNLGSLPGGRRNRASWLPPYRKSAIPDVSSPSSKTAVNEVFAESDNSSPTYKSQGSYSGSTPESVHKARGKDPAGYFEVDHSAPEEDIQIPVVTKHLQSAGISISRRTKGSPTAKTGRVSSDSPKSKTETTYSGSSIMGQSNLNDNAPFELRSGTKASTNKNSSSQASVQKPKTPTSSEIPKTPVSSEKGPGEMSGKKPSHVHPKLPDFESFTAHLQSLRTNRQ